MIQYIKFVLLIHSVCLYIFLLSSYYIDIPKAQKSFFLIHFSSSYFLFWFHISTNYSVFDILQKENLPCFWGPNIQLFVSWWLVTRLTYYLLPYCSSMLHMWNHGIVWANSQFEASYAFLQSRGYRMRSSHLDEYKVFFLCEYIYIYIYIYIY